MENVKIGKVQRIWIENAINGENGTGAKNWDIKCKNWQKWDKIWMEKGKIGHSSRKWDRCKQFGWKTGKFGHISRKWDRCKEFGWKKGNLDTAAGNGTANLDIAAGNRTGAKNLDRKRTIWTQQQEIGQVQRIWTEKGKFGNSSMKWNRCKEFGWKKENLDIAAGNGTGAKNLDRKRKFGRSRRRTWILQGLDAQGTTLSTKHEDQKFKNQKPKQILNFSQLKCLPSS